MSLKSIVAPTENSATGSETVTGTDLGPFKRGLDINSLNGGELSSYGVKETVSNTAFIRAAPVYGLVPANFREFTATGGSTGVESREFKVSTGTSVGGYGAIQSFRSLNIEYGQTALCRFGARFPTNLANSWQGVGLLSITDELSFGYNGTIFGVWHRYGGEAEVRTIQVTTPAGGSENATVTINGTGYTVPLTSGTVQLNAKQIADYLTANATGFYAEQINDSVVVSAASDGAKSSTWSFSSSSATATITRNTAGVTKTSNHIAQENFNGSVPTNFDPSKGNDYAISYGAGYGDISYRIFNSDTQRYEVAHIIKNSSSIERTNVNNPSLKTGLYCVSIGSTTNIDTYCSYISGFSQGDRSETRNPRAFKNTKSISTTLTNILTIRNKRIYNGYINQAEIAPSFLSIANEGNKSLVIQIRGNPTVSGTTNFQNLGNNLIVETEIAGTTVSENGRLLTSFTVAPSSDKTINLKDLQIRVPPTLRLVIAAAQLTGGSAASVTATLVWIEDI